MNAAVKSFLELLEGIFAEGERIEVLEILEPESCMLVAVDNRTFHIMIEEVE